MCSRRNVYGWPLNHFVLRPQVVFLAARKWLASRNVSPPKTLHLKCHYGSAFQCAEEPTATDSQGVLCIVVVRCSTRFFQRSLQISSENGEAQGCQQSRTLLSGVALRYTKRFSCFRGQVQFQLPAMCGVLGVDVFLIVVVRCDEMFSI